MPARSLLAALAALSLASCRSAPVAGGGAAPEGPACADVRELDAAYFAGGSADLAPAAGRGRGPLAANVAVLLRCPAVTARVFAYAADGEPDPVALSQARADAVRAYYVAGGVAAGRITAASGRGVAPQARVATDTTARPSAPSRRADTVPSVPGH